MKLNIMDESGAATAEYVIAMMAAVGFAGLVVVIMKSDEGKNLLTTMGKNALAMGG